MIETLTISQEEPVTLRRGRSTTDFVDLKAPHISEEVEVKVIHPLPTGNEYVVVSYPYSEAQIERYFKIQEIVSKARQILDRFSLTKGRNQALPLADHPLQLLAELDEVFRDPNSQLPSLVQEGQFNHAIVTDSSRYTFALRNVLQLHESVYRSLLSTFKNMSATQLSERPLSADQVVMSLKQVLVWFDEKMGSSL